MAAVDSAGLTTDTDAIVHTIGAVLEEWPHQDRVVMASFPAMTVMRRAVLLACIGDIACFRDDRQLRKLLGWYPEARESGSSLSKHRLGRSGNRLARRELWLSTWSCSRPRATPPPSAITTVDSESAAWPARCHGPPGRQADLRALLLPAPRGSVRPAAPRS